jgi:hypothetical protein
MPDKILFEYAVLRVVPKVEREEFCNVGVVLYCPKLKFLGVLYHLDGERLKAFAGELDVPEVGQYLQAFEKICAGSRDSGPIGKLPVADRFRWLTAARREYHPAGKYTGAAPAPPRWHKSSFVQYTLYSPRKKRPCPTRLHFAPSEMEYAWPPQMRREK